MRGIRYFSFISMLLGMLSGTSAQAKTYTLGIVPWVGCIPAVIAEHKGFWKKQGIEVRTLAFDDMLFLEKMFYDRRIDILYHMLAAVTTPYLGNVGAIKSQHAGIRGAKSLMIVETDWSHGGDKIIVKADMSAEMLKGKVVGVYLAQPSILHLLGSYLESAGLTLGDVKLIEKSSAALSDNFIKGVVSAIISFDPDALTAENQGNGKVVATSADFEGIIPEGLMMLDDTFQQTPQEDLTKLLTGWIDAAEWMLDPANREEMVEITNKYLIHETRAEDIAGMMTGVRFHDRETLRKRNLDGATLKYFQDLHDFLHRNKLLQGSFTPAAVFDSRALSAALERK